MSESTVSESAPSDPAPTSAPSTDDHDAPAPDVAATAAPIDLDAIERDLSDVQTALERLNDGTYWTDEMTGETIPDDVLAAHPTARTTAPTLT